jgi:hypothetical protein
MVLGSNGEFTSTGIVLDYDANGKLLTTGCFTHTATRLTAGFDRRSSFRHSPAPSHAQDFSPDAHHHSSLPPQLGLV